MNARNEPSSIEAVEKSVLVLEALRELDGAGVTELASHLGMAKATVYSHLTTLNNTKLVVQEDAEYRLGLRFLDFGEYTKQRSRMYPVAKSEVDALAEESGETAQFLVEEHGEGVYLYKTATDRAIQTGARTGSRRPLHCTALGKSVLAHLPEERVESIVDRNGLPRHTPNTLTDRDDLYEALEEVRERGYALDDEEVQPGLRCVAAPILDFENDVLGAISVAGPTSRMSGTRFRETIPEMVTNSANIIEINVRHV
jgi:DNA-binding IclR family transcriptional regulator